MKIRAVLPESRHFRQITNKGDRHRWKDLATDNLRILSADPVPWGQPWDILLRIEQGKTRGGLRYPRRLELLCLPPETGTPSGRILRERWTGNFAGSVEPTLRTFVFPGRSRGSQSWLILSILADQGNLESPSE